MRAHSAHTKRSHPNRRLSEPTTLPDYARKGPKTFPKGCPVVLAYINTGAAESTWGPTARSWDPYGHAALLDGPEALFNGARAPRHKTQPQNNTKKSKTFQPQHSNHNPPVAARQPRTPAPARPPRTAQASTASARAGSASALAATLPSMRSCTCSTPSAASLPPSRVVVV